jgi:hypothetical protein
LRNRKIARQTSFIFSFFIWFVASSVTYSIVTPGDNAGQYLVCIALIACGYGLPCPCGRRRVLK